MIQICLRLENDGMTFDEQKAHFSLWSLVKSPLLIGCDISAPTQQTLSILMNQEVIAINQDSLGVQGTKITTGSVTGGQVWGGPLSNGEYAVVLFNRANVTTTITANWSDLGIKGNYKVRDLWAHQYVGCFPYYYAADVVPHGVVMVKLTPTKKHHC